MQPHEMPRALLVIIDTIRYVRVDFSRIRPPLMRRLPLRLQVSKRSPRRQRHRVLLQRKSSSFHHYLKKLLEPCERANVDNGKRVEDPVVRVHSSGDLELAPEVYVDDHVVCGPSCVVVADHINVLVIACMQREIVSY